MKFRLGELFCGPGGLAWGAMNAKIADPKFRIVHQWANDYDQDTCNTYAYQYMGSASLYICKCKICFSYEWCVFLT